MESRETGEIGKVNRTRMTDKAPMESRREYLDMDTDEEEFGHQETPEPEDEAPQEPDKPEFTETELDALTEKTKALTVLANLTGTDWNEDCSRVIREYFCEPAKTVLTIFFHGGELRALHGFPHSTQGGLAYFLRQPWQVYTPDNFIDSVIFGSVNRTTENTLLKLVGNLYAPLVFKNQHWPDIKRDDIFSNLNDFLTRAVQVTHKPMGISVLYVPIEGTQVQRQPRQMDSVEAARMKCNDDKYLRLNRLEKVARTWVKQIREALLLPPIPKQKLHDLTDEFETWKIRYENLSCISRQLQSDRIRFIIGELRKINSSSISDLRTLGIKVGDALKESTSNLTYLHMILDYCKALKDPKKIQDCLPNILYAILFVWSYSLYYRMQPNIEELLCSLSVQIVRMCIDSIDLQLIFDEPHECRKMFDACLNCSDIYSEIYDKIVENCIEQNDDWAVDKKNVFNSVVAFRHRCEDVVEICDTIIIFGSLNKINLGGTKGNSLEIRFRHAKDYFLQILDEMKICCNYALDIKNVNWFQDMEDFRSDIAKLENTLKNLLIRLFEDAENLDMCIETLYTLFKFKDRHGFQEILNEKWAKVWQKFYEELKLCPLEQENGQKYEIVPDQIKLSQSESTSILQDTKNFLTRLHKMMINASDWLGDNDVQFEIPSKFLNSMVNH